VIDADEIDWQVVVDRAMERALTPRSQRGFQFFLSHKDYVLAKKWAAAGYRMNDIGDFTALKMKESMGELSGRIQAAGQQGPAGGEEAQGQLRPEGPEGGGRV
jgi:hypothetical protein